MATTTSKPVTVRALEVFATQLGKTVRALIGEARAPVLGQLDAHTARIAELEGRVAALEAAAKTPQE